MSVKRGDVYDVDLSGAKLGEKQNDPVAGSRPCVVVQNDKGNENSPLTIVVPLTDERQFKKLPVQVLIDPDGSNGLTKVSVAECGHVRSVDMKRLSNRRGRFSSADMAKVDKVLRASLAL